MLLSLLIAANLLRPHAMLENTYLDHVAQKRADYLCQSGAAFSHDGWTGSQFWGAPYFFWVRGENLAQGFQSATSTNYDAMQAAFVASPEHLKNIVDPRFIAMGLAHECNITVEEFGGF